MSGKRSRLLRRYAIGMAQQENLDPKYFKRYFRSVKKAWNKTSKQGRRVMSPLF